LFIKGLSYSLFILITDVQPRKADILTRVHAPHDIRELKNVTSTSDRDYLPELRVSDGKTGNKIACVENRGKGKGAGDNPLTQTLEAALKKYFGYDNFRYPQEEVINSVLRGKDVLAILATGGGKSLCYQIPAIFRKGGMTLVISPLIALMKDQVSDLNERGINAFAWTSECSLSEVERIKTSAKKGELQLVYVSPERAVMPSFLREISSWPVQCIAVDEAHCISLWGHQFRPEYCDLVIIKAKFPDIPIIAVTATATPMVQKEIIERLRLNAPDLFIGSFNRTNLNYKVRSRKNAYLDILSYMRMNKEHSGIIYCTSKKDVGELSRKLRKDGQKAIPYHAGLSYKEREINQELFRTGKAKIICATVAFGMGINKPDVRFVFHYGMPKSVEQYYQETGRAGRDGKEAECILYYERSEYFRLRALIRTDNSQEAFKKVSLAKLEQMLQYCETRDCRRKNLLAYFGEEANSDTCEQCDNCLSLPGEKKTGIKSWKNKNQDTHQKISSIMEIRS